MTIEPIFILFFGISFIIIILIVWIISLEMKIKKVLHGDAKNLYQSISNIEKDLQKIGIQQVEVEKYLTLVEKRLRNCVQSAKTVRFNPFKGSSGSNQSFATAFIDEKGDGSVISTLYSRERVSVFAKPIKNYESEYELTNEEKRVIKEVRTQTTYDYGKEK